MRLRDGVRCKNRQYLFLNELPLSYNRPLETVRKSNCCEQI